MALWSTLSVYVAGCIATATAAAAETPRRGLELGFSPESLRVSGAEHSSAGFIDTGDGHLPVFRWSLSCPGCMAVTQNFFQLTVRTKEVSGAEVFGTGKIPSRALRHLASAEHAGRLLSN
eukprot:SAG11_NODE_15070_length_590_cov_0.859470_1_plen_119_part_10